MEESIWFDQLSLISLTICIQILMLAVSWSYPTEGNENSPKNHDSQKSQNKNQLHHITILAHKN